MSVQLEVTRQDTYVLITLRGERPPSMEELGPRLRDALEQAVEWNLPVGRSGCAAGVVSGCSGLQATVLDIRCLDT